jgi:stage II sporulation protein D
LEVLKAQAVAARTYTLRNLGEFESEGYDICSTPRCQVYGGMGVEHKRSDRAVRETEGQVVLSDGQPAETFYSASCGGHTENVEVVFPLKLGTYLRGVPCMEAGAGRLVSKARAEAGFPNAITHRLLPPAPGRPTQVLSARFEHLAFLAGLPIPRDRLRDTSRQEVLRFVGSVFDLALHKRLLMPPEHLASLLARPPEDWRRRDQRFAIYVLTSGLSTGDGKAPILADEAEELLFELALYLGALRFEGGRYLSMHDRLLTVRQGAEQHEHQLPESVLTFRQLDDDDLASAPLELMAGDRLDFYWRSDELLALVQPVAASLVDLKRHARRLSWTRFKTRQQLTKSVQARYPGFPFKGFEVMSRGVSGRIGKLRLLGADGEQMMVEGLAVRWTMDLYDTNFYFKPRGDDPGAKGWTFKGRGWGHGVGMCQAGAYGMAARGIGYRAILEHYYTGIELGHLMPAPTRQRVAGEHGR